MINAAKRSTPDADGLRLVTSVSDVVKHGYCVGCGACSVVDQRVRMQFNEYKVYQAVPDQNDQGSRANAVCPFSSSVPNETALGQQLFGANGYDFDRRVGFYNGLLAGRIVDQDAVAESSSGGLTSWLLLELLRRRLVDGIIHVGFSDDAEAPLFEYRLSESEEDVRSSKKSQYYSTHFADMLSHIRGNGKRYAFVGVPCFVKAVRLLQQSDQDIKAQIVFAIGLVCGHLKSGAFAEVMSYQVGVEPSQIDRVDFRVKNKTSPANAYDFGAREKARKRWSYHVSRELLGGNWGHALFQLKACDFCDDIFAETADVCFGDAWLPRYEPDWRGTNIVIVRNELIKSLIEEAQGKSEIAVEAVTLDDIVGSQAGNFRHRWDGLSVRLEDAVKAGKAVPVKRIAPGSIPVSSFRRKLIRLRQQISEHSHVAYLRYSRNHDRDGFLAEVRSQVSRMENLYRSRRYTTARFWLGLPRKLARRLGVFQFFGRRRS